jgi:hypothetical protein
MSDADMALMSATLDRVYKENAVLEERLAQVTLPLTLLLTPVPIRRAGQVWQGAIAWACISHRLSTDFDVACHQAWEGGEESCLHEQVTDLLRQVRPQGWDSCAGLPCRHRASMLAAREGGGAAGWQPGFRQRKGQR